jgi:hypothetical protein
MEMRKAALIATIGLTAIGCGAGELMPSQPGGRDEKGGAGAAPVPPAGGTGGAAGAAVPPGPGIALVTNADGWLEPNAAGAVGAWWSTGDYYGEDGTPGAGSCPNAGFPMSACSTLTTPTPGMWFRPDPAGGEMCTSGIAAQVLMGNDGQFAWSAIWGNIVGFNLATPDSGPAPAVGNYDAPAHGITGFAFNIDGVLPFGHLRVLVTTADNHRTPPTGTARRWICRRTAGPDVTRSVGRRSEARFTWAARRLSTPRRSRRSGSTS